MPLTRETLARKRDIEAALVVLQESIGQEQFVDLTSLVHKQSVITFYGAKRVAHANAGSQVSQSEPNIVREVKEFNSKVYHTKFSVNISFIFFIFINLKLSINN